MRSPTFALCAFQLTTAACASSYRQLVRRTVLTASSRSIGARATTNSMLQLMAAREAQHRSSFACAHRVVNSARQVGVQFNAAQRALALTAHSFPKCASCHHSSHFVTHRLPSKALPVSASVRWV
jgi:hypothetical protein